MDTARHQKGIHRVKEDVIAAGGRIRIRLREEVPGAVAAVAIHLRRADLNLVARRSQI
jgi:hypothetical protein